MSYRDRRDNVPLDCKVYVGNLGSGASRNELEKEFSYFGKLVNVWVARNPPGFAYVEFEDSRDAKDACRELDGRKLCGRRAKVELSHGQQRQRGGRDSGRGGPPPRRSNMMDVRCFTCGDKGHYARDCPRGPRSRSRSPRRKSRSSSRGRSPSRSRSRSKSQSPAEKKSRSRSRSHDRKSRSSEPNPNGRHSESRSRSRSRSPS